MNIINQNPYRVLGVLSNSPIKDRIGNQNRLSAYAKVRREVSFPNDFATVIAEKPIRTVESVAAANTSLNLDKDQIRYALFWFVNGSSIDDIALKHLQSNNVEKAKELFQKKETFSTLINLGVLAFIEKDYSTGFSYLSKVVHDANYRSELLTALGLQNSILTEDEVASLFIEELLHEVPAATLLSAASNETDKAVISKRALEEPLSSINAAIATAKSVDSNNANASLAAGTNLMNSTKKALKQVKDIAGARSPQYQLIADNLAKQILQCGINYYNNASDDDVESPRKAMVLQEYALKIAVGQLTKQRCQENYDILKQAVDNMPPAEVAVEARKVKEELRSFCSKPDKISYSITLLNNTKPLLQTIKTKLGATNSFYLSLSTQVVGNALHNLIEEVNSAQNYFSAVIKAIKESGVDPSLLNYIGDEHSPAKIIDNKVKPVIREAWRATTIMDGFDMEADFRKNRYTVNRTSLKEMCDSLGISTYSSSSRTTTTTRTSSRPTTTTRPSTTSSSSSSTSSSSSDSNDAGWIAFWIATIACAFWGAFADGRGFDFLGFLVGGGLGALIPGNILKSIFGK